MVHVVLYDINNHRINGNGTGTNVYEIGVQCILYNIVNIVFKYFCSIIMHECYLHIYVLRHLYVKLTLY